MNNDELAKWNADIDEVKRARVRVQLDAMRSRGWKRRAYLWVARLYKRIEATGERWRSERLWDD